MTGSIVFSDIDGTLLFHEKLHGVSAINHQNEDLVEVLDSISETQHLAYDVSTIPDYKVYFGVETHGLAQEISADSDFFCLTGGRLASLRKRKKYFGFLNGAILENGGVIIDKDWSEDEEWNSHLNSERRYLSEVSQYLKSCDWRLDIEGRRSSIRIKLRDNPQKSEHDFETLGEDLILPDELKRIDKRGVVDIVLKSSGKENAVRYLLQKRNQYRDVIGVGHDLNDLDFLVETGSNYVLSNSHKQILDRAQRSSWYISNAPSIAGINEILNLIMNRK